MTRKNHEKDRSSALQQTIGSCRLDDKTYIQYSCTFNDQIINIDFTSYCDKPDSSGRIANVGINNIYTPWIGSKICGSYYKCVQVLCLVNISLCEGMIME